MVVCGNKSDLEKYNIFLLNRRNFKEQDLNHLQ